MKKFSISILVVVAIMIGIRGLFADTGKVIPLPSGDKAILEQVLGSGVVGKAIPAMPIADTSQYVHLQEASWTFRYTSGKKKGQDVIQTMSELKRDTSRNSWRYSVAHGNVYFLNKDQKGGLSVTSEQDTNQGVTSRFSPYEPIFVPGLKPGEIRKTKIDVKVYDLSKPTHLSHQGSLDLTLSYIGAYEVHVPAGTFKGSLIKWHYNGKIGPAKVDDVQYRFLAEKVGIAAMIDKRNISAVLIYHDRSKTGKVLVKHP
jgi:hypothetical protein